MFIRMKKIHSSQSIVVQLIEAYRKNGAPKQRVLRHIGTGKTEAEINKLKELASAIKTQLTHQMLAKNKNNVVGKYAKAVGTLREVKEETSIELSKIQELEIRILGIHDVYGYIYDLLGFTNPFSHPARREYSASVLREIVLCRIAYPSSKRETVEIMQDAFGVTMNLDHIYQMMDKIDDTFCERIQERALAATLCLTGSKLKVLFYDATTLYFESFTEDELKQNGYSKDMKFNQPQVLLALFVTTDGLPVGYELFPGATYEGHTLQPILNKLKARYQIDEMIFVADRGMLNDANLNYLEENNIPYIVGAKLKSLSKKIQKEVLDWGQEVKSIDQIKENSKNLELSKKDAEYFYNKNIAINPKKHLIISYQRNRAKKDKHDREKAILKLQQKLAKSSNPKNIISNYGYQKYILIEGEATLKINEDKLKTDTVWDGLYGVYTNNTKLNNMEILNHYRSLWQVEESFRINKHDLSIRPIYHWAPDRVKAHIAISFMAFVCVKYLEYLVKTQYKKLSPETIKDELLSVRVGIIKNHATKKRYILPTRINQDAKQIYRISGIKIPDKAQIVA
jgi:transposase